MTYAASEARKELLEEIAQAIEELARAIAAVGEAYDAVDERMADRIEADLFKPLQGAYAAATRTHTGFASRHDLPARTFPPANQPAPHGVRELVETAVDDAAHAEQILADLQDSMAPVEVGDPELRAGLADVRRRLGQIPGQAERLVRVLGR
ncbi:MAG: hypothetical protein QOG77_324 [Solirubrobacteraceae bacterium]|nr:hypothetical protein [Solirubrobacteraceae bacterium]